MADNRKPHRCTVGSVTFLAAISGILSVSHAQIIVDSRPLKPTEVLKKKAVFAFRAIPPDLVSASSPYDGKAVVSSAPVFRSYYADATIDRSLQTELKLLQEADQTREATERIIETYRLLRKNQSDAPEPVSLTDPKTRQEFSVDAEAVRRIAGYSSLAQGSLVESERSSSDTSLIIDGSFSQKLHKRYKLVDIAKSDPSRSDARVVLADATSNANLDPRVAYSVLLNEGDAEFGIPLAFSSADKKLKVEHSLSKTYNVYWIEFAISPSQELVDKASELTFSVKFENPAVIALELIPLRFGPNVKVTSTANTPELKVKEVEVGKFYEQSVEYEYLKPTIMARGLHTSSFGWIMRDDAVDPSSKRLIAIVGAPKTERILHAAISLSGQLREWYGLQSKYASTEPVLAPITLP